MIHIFPLLLDLHWLHVPKRIKFRLAVPVFRCHNQAAHEYLSRELQWFVEVESRRRLWSASYAEHNWEQLVIIVIFVMPFGKVMHPWILTVKPSWPTRPFIQSTLSSIIILVVPSPSFRSPGRYPEGMFFLSYCWNSAPNQPQKSLKAHIKFHQHSSTFACPWGRNLFSICFEMPYILLPEVYEWKTGKNRQKKNRKASNVMREEEHWKGYWLYGTGLTTGHYLILEL